MKTVPAVDDSPVVAELGKIVSLTSTARPPSVNGTRSTGFAALEDRTMYNESSLRLSSTNSPDGSLVIEYGPPIWSDVSFAVVRAFHTLAGLPLSVDITPEMVFFGFPESWTITGV